MKTPDDIATELEALVRSHYYSEDFELRSSLKTYRATLSDQELSYLKQVILARLMNDGSIVDVLLCSVVHLPSAEPILVEKLNKETDANQLTRMLIVTLSSYQSNASYFAVERFLDSDQEIDALEALGKIDFPRTLPVFFRLMSQEQYQTTLLQILYNRSKQSGVDALIRDLHKSPVELTPGLIDSLSGLLYSKKDSYNPFSPNEIRRIIQSVRQA